MKLKILLEKDEDTCYVATCPSLPGCISQGKTKEKALKNIKEAIQLHLKCLSEDGLPIVRSQKQTELLVNVPL